MSADDVGTTILVNGLRDAPCICPRQHDEVVVPLTEITAISYARGVPVQSVRCQMCGERWKRIVVKEGPV